MFQNDTLDGNILCRIQVCPKVLRQTVCDLFPYRNLDNSELSVITISLRPDLKLLRKNNEVETEKLAKTVCYTSESCISIKSFTFAVCSYSEKYM